MPDQRHAKARVVLLRHGESTWNEREIVQGQLDDARLSPEGRVQAGAVAETLRGYSFQWIVTSDLTRARETAAIVDDALGQEVAVAPALRERCYGVYEGRPLAELPSSASGVKDGRVVDSSARPEGGESLDDLYELLNQDRMNRWMLTLEITIVLLFVIDLVMLFFSMRH